MPEFELLRAQDTAGWCGPFICDSEHAKNAVFVCKTPGDTDRTGRWKAIRRKSFAKVSRK